jgi:hypothetical protein
MGLKSVVVALSLSFLCVVPQVVLADTITLTGASGGSTDGEDVYPYLFTVANSNGVNTDVNMSCLNFDREVSFGETWNVDMYGVSSISPAGLDGESQINFRADAWLFNKYNTSAGTNSEIQFAIWSIMDPSQLSTLDGFDATAQALAAIALNNAAMLPPTYYGMDVVYIPDANDAQAWTSGQPQIFMAEVPPAETPEPRSLFLMGTAMLLGVAVLSRRLGKV